MSNNNWICGLVNSFKSNIKLILFNVYGPICTLEKNQFGKKLVATW